MRACDPPPRAPWAPAPRRHTPAELVALLQLAVARRGVRSVDVGVFAACHAVLAVVRRQAAGAAPGRRGCGAVARTSSSFLVRALGPTMGWEATGDRWEDRDDHQASVRRWLRDLQRAQLLRVDVVVDELNQERAIDVTLLEVPWIPDEELEEAGRRLDRWRRRYGPAFEGSRRAGPIMARLRASREAIAARYLQSAGQAPQQERPNKSGTPPRGATAMTASLFRGKRSTEKASCGAGARALARKGETRPKAPTPANRPAALNGPAKTFCSDGGGVEPSLESLEARVAERKRRATALRPRLATQAADAERLVLEHVATAEEPLPPLPALRLAVAARLLGVDQLAAGVPVPGLSSRYLRRLQTAARRWLRHAPAGAAAPAVVLLELASTDTGVRTIAELVRRFAQLVGAVRDDALANGPAGACRRAAAWRRAERDRAGILAAWPAWLQRVEDAPVRRGEWGRFLQVDRLPDRAELERPELRRWLRSATALWFGAPLSAVELTDAEGRYAFVPLSAPELRRRSERARSPWLGSRPTKGPRRRR